MQARYVSRATDAINARNECRSRQTRRRCRMNRGRAQLEIRVTDNKQTGPFRFTRGAALCAPHPGSKGNPVWNPARFFINAR
jgi:hypothetical protein